jgi:hypothetical protein
MTSLYECGRPCDQVALGTSAQGVVMTAMPFACMRSKAWRCARESLRRAYIACVPSLVVAPVLFAHVVVTVAKSVDYHAVIPVSAAVRY